MNVGRKTFRERSSDSKGQAWMGNESVSAPASMSGLSEAELAHANVLAINRDLDERIQLLESSRSYRLGQAFFKTARILLFPLTWFSKDVVESVHVERAWPFLSGEVVLRRPSILTLDVVVSAGEQLLVRTRIDLRNATPTGKGRRYSVAFTVPYDINSQAFPFDQLRISIGDHHFGGADLDGHLKSRPELCHPLDIVAESIIDVVGDTELFKEQLPTHAGVAVLATFRDTFRQHDYSNSLIEDLKACGFLVVVVDTSPVPRAEAPNSDLYVYRRNVGWDFASWISILCKFPWLMSEAQNLLLLNDSNVGPLVPIKEIIERGLDSQLDVWGITDSWEIAYHLQSYFLFFRGHVLSAGHLRDFISAYAFPRSKNAIIEKGEIGLSAHLVSQGLRIGALFPYEFLSRQFLASVGDRIVRGRRQSVGDDSLARELATDSQEIRFTLSVKEQVHGAQPLNPTHYFWDELIAAGSPFVKRELLVRNPERVPNLSRLVEMANTERARRVLLEEVRLCRKSGPNFSLELALRSHHS